MFLYSVFFFYLHEIPPLKDLGNVSLGSTYAKEKQVFVLITQILTDQTRCSTIPNLLIAESLKLVLASEIYLVLLFVFAKNLLLLKVHTRFLKCFVIPLFQGLQKFQQKIKPKTCGEQSFFNLLCMFLNNR